MSLTLSDSQVELLRNLCADSWSVSSGDLSAVLDGSDVQQVCKLDRCDRKRVRPVGSDIAGYWVCVMHGVPMYGPGDCIRRFFAGEVVTQGDFITDTSEWLSLNVLAEDAERWREMVQ